MQLYDLKGIGPESLKKLAILGIHSVDELLRYFPRRYEDYSTIAAIEKLRPGLSTIQAHIKQVKGRYVRRGMHISEAIASDATGSIKLVWFNQPYRATHIKPGNEYLIAGDYGLRRNRFSMLNPSVELVSDFPINTARIVPIYRETKGFNSLAIRRLVRQALDSHVSLPEPMPAWLIDGLSLTTYDLAVREMHFPSSAKDLSTAKKRLAFDEIFELTLAALLNKYELLKDKATSIPFDERLAKEFVAALPFSLTDGQRKAVWQIYQDMSRTQPMNRLLEGDVGSGKTVVAAMASMMAMRQGFSVAFMAPTELLARQHADTLYQMLSRVGFGESISLLVGGMKKSQKESVRSAAKAGHASLLIGTHALLQGSVSFKDLSLVIVDEQHRFGVEQRKLLQAKAKAMPHVLHMTATPIPRTLALTLYGELDISLLDELPAGRQPIISKITSPNSRAQLYARIDEQITLGRQIYIVCPLISPQKSEETSWSQDLQAPLPSAETTYERLAKHEFKHRRVGLLHGKLKAAEKDAIMRLFSSGELDILVSTTVIEVGVDVPNATIMLIEGAERFGLAQIHQLRGRVGRSSHQSYCFIMPSTSNAPGPRLRALEGTQDGFALAELDLELRGPGAIYGTMQHGALDLRIANLSDVRLIATARSAAQKFIDHGEDLLQYQALASRVMKLRAVTNLN